MPLPSPHPRRGLAALVLAIAAGAGAPLAATLPTLFSSAVPPPEREIAHTLMIACPRLPGHDAGEPPTPWLSRCGLPR